MMIKFISDTRLMFGRSLTRTVRNPMWIIVNLFQPLLYLLLFAPLLEGLQIPGFTQTNSLNYFVPGLLVMIAFSAAFFGMNVLDDLRDGVVERLRVTPASRLALLLGMVLQDVLVFLAQCGALVVLATIMGLRPDWTGMLLLFGLLALVGLTMLDSIDLVRGNLFKTAVCVYCSAPQTRSLLRHSPSSTTWGKS
ncbi:MAG TPA: ABC transporter permease [Anaerolineae bacterium]